MLEQSNDTEKGGIIVLVTDGKNSPGYLNIADVQQDIINAGIRVVSVAFGFVYCHQYVRYILITHNNITGNKLTRILSNLPT